MCAVRFTSLASVNESCNHGAAADGDALELGEVEADGDTLGEGELLTLALGESDGDSLGEGLTDGDGLTDGLSLALGERLADGEGVGLTLGEPTDATLRISTMPPTLGDAVLRVKLALATVPAASNDWSAHTTPCESLRSVHGLGVVNVGVPSAIQVSCTVDLVEVRTSAGHVPLVDEPFDCVAVSPIGVVWSGFRYTLR